MVAVVTEQRVAQFTADMRFSFGQVANMSVVQTHNFIHSHGTSNRPEWEKRRCCSLLLMSIDLSLKIHLSKYSIIKADRVAKMAGRLIFRDVKRIQSREDMLSCYEICKR